MNYQQGGYGVLLAAGDVGRGGVAGQRRVEGDKNGCVDNYMTLRRERGRGGEEIIRIPKQLN